MDKNFFRFSKKILAVLKKNKRGDRLGSPGMVCYVGKQENPFWFSSLGQRVQFAAILFCTTFNNYFGQFVWLEKSHFISRVSLHGALTKNNAFGGEKQNKKEQRWAVRPLWQASQSENTASSPPLLDHLAVNMVSLLAMGDSIGKRCCNGCLPT